MIVVENPALRETGPVVFILVGLSEAAESELRRARRPVPQPIRANALIDTGSGRSIIQRDLARSLGLTPIGTVEFDTPSSVDVSASEYDVRFWLDGEVSFESRVMEAPLPVPRVQALIGRDILALGVLTYDGPRGRFTFEFGERTAGRGRGSTAFRAP
jgi:hypothetical protein